MGVVPTTECCLVADGRAVSGLTEGGVVVVAAVAISVLAEVDSVLLDIVRAILEEFPDNCALSRTQK